MGITSNADTAELSSPFYKKNLKFCKEFEHYIGSKNGFVKGSYNAWSYAVTGKFKLEGEWVLHYWKSTFSNGNLLLSSKYQNLVVACTWSRKNLNEGSNFKIRKKKLLDSINPSWKTLKENPFYSIKTKQPESELLLRLTTILFPLFVAEAVFSIEYANNDLKIELRTEELHTDMVDKLLELR